MAERYTNNGNDLIKQIGSLSKTDRKISKYRNRFQTQIDYQYGLFADSSGGDTTINRQRHEGKSYRDYWTIRGTRREESRRD